MHKKSGHKRASSAKKAVPTESLEPANDATVDRAAEARTDDSVMTDRSTKPRSATKKRRRRNRRSTSDSLSSRSGHAVKTTDDAAADAILRTADTKRSGTTSTVPSSSFEAPLTTPPSVKGADSVTAGSVCPEGLEVPSTQPSSGPGSSDPSKAHVEADATSGLTKNQALVEHVSTALSVQPWTSSASGSLVELPAPAAKSEHSANEGQPEVTKIEASSPLPKGGPSVAFPTERTVTAVPFLEADAVRTPNTPLATAVVAPDLRRSDSYFATTSARSGQPQQRRLGDFIQLISGERLTTVVERVGSFFILASVLLFVAVLTFVLLLLVGGRHRGGDKSRLCSSPDCVDHARALGMNFERSPSPCESFGRFVCSGWNSGDRDFATTVPRQVALEWILRVEKMSLGDFDRNAVVNRPLVMMGECMHNTADEQDAVAALIALVDGSSFAWPTESEEPETPVSYYRALRLLLELSVLWALPLWFRVRLLPATAQLQRDCAVVLSPSGLSTTWHVFHRTLLRYADAYPIYVSYFNSRILKYRPPSRSFMAFLKTKSSTLQTQVFDNLSSVFNTLHGPSRLLEIQSLQAAVSKLVAEDWVQAFRSLYKSSHNITADDLLLVTNSGLLKAANFIFAANTAQDILFHTIWWFVQFVGAATSNELFAAVKEHSDSAFFRQIVCFDHAYTTYGMLLAAIHKQMFSTSERVSIARLLENVRAVAVEKLRSYSKLSEARRRALSNVLGDMATVIWPEDDLGRPDGFAEYYGQPYRGRDGFLGEWMWSRLQLRSSRAARTVGSRGYLAASMTYLEGPDGMMSYNPVLNTVSVSLQATRPPFYYGQGTNAMTYGGLGFLYARTILEALNDVAYLLQGGVVMRPSDATKTWTLWNVSLCQNTDTRLAFPEMPALDVAYTAYIRFRDEASDLPLKGLPCCTPEQVFFATVCHCSCHVGSSKRKQSQVCDLAVKGFEPFSIAFSCPVGSYMNQSKCVYA